MSLQERTLYLAMELSNKKWKLCFGDGERIRQRTLEARDQKGLHREIAKTKEKFGLSPDAPVTVGYEAGRDGHWIARMLRKNGYNGIEMDPASIEVSRRARHRKTDRLDAEKLLKLLIRRELWNEKQAFSEVRIPSEEQEDWMRLHRERIRLKKERTAQINRMKSLCNIHGIKLGNPLKQKLELLRDWEGKPLRPRQLRELERHQQRLRMIAGQLKELGDEQKEAVKKRESEAMEKVAKLQNLKSVGMQTSWILVQECLGWRHFANRKQLGSFVGLTGTPYDSGDSLREQGISKAGNRRIRGVMIELAWLWVRWQPESALTRWFIDRFVLPNDKRSKRKGIVALARKLLIALWKYLEYDIVPEGAIMKA